MFVFIHPHDMIFFIAFGKPADCSDVRGECWKKLKWLKDCNEGKFLFDHFVRRCGEITMQDVLRPKKPKKKGFFQTIWDDVSSAFNKIG
jgi:hypothetical protein